MNRRRWISNLLKAIVSLGALAWVLSRIPFEEIWQTVKGANGWLLFSVYLLLTVSLVIRAARWHVLLQALGALVPFGRLVELYFVGAFFNSFLPSGFGGDIVRAAEVTRDVEPGAAVGTVIVDRLAGLMVLFIMALAALPFSVRMLPANVVWPIAGVSLAGLVAGFVLLHGGAMRGLSVILERLLPEKISRTLSPSGEGPVGKVHHALTGCGWKAVGRALGVSALFNSILVLWWYLGGQAIGINVSVWAYVTFVPVLSVALMVPSIGGLGVREGLSSILFASAGVSEAEGVALSLVIFVLNRAVSLIGGLVYLVSSIRDMQNEKA